MKRIGIMTFHAAHNYGSVFQAYATQQLLNRLGYESEIINYRLGNQRAYYNHLYSRRFGSKEFLRRIMRLPEHGKRSKRSARFEAFIRKRFRLSPQEYHNYSELCQANLDYDVLLSGSDQVWNRHCTAEFKTEPPESILGYYLSFGKEDAKRISFSSSFGGMKEEEIAEYREYLARYSHISVREAESAQVLSHILGKPIANTLDPTLMLNRKEWALDGTYDVPGRYVFVYTLQRQRAARKLIQAVKRFADERGLEVVSVSPFCIPFVAGVRAFPECGPLDFLSYIRNAETVITDSFHGTVLSVNFGKEFYSLYRSGGPEFRKTDILSRLGLLNRVVYDAAAIPELDLPPIVYPVVYEKLEILRQHSLNYLKIALEE